MKTKKTLRILKTTRKKTLKGLSIYLCFGSYGGFSLKVKPKLNMPFRLSLGWMSFVVISYDLENLFEKLMHDGIKINHIIKQYKKEKYLGE